MRDRLLDLARRLVPGARGLVRLDRLSGGANNETWAFDVDASDGTVPLILRRKAGGEDGLHVPDDPDVASIPLELEAGVLSAVGAAGVPVPRVRAVLEGSDALGRGVVMDRLPGETRPKTLLHDAAFAPARGRMIADCAQALAAVHRVPLASLPCLRTSSPEGELALWERRWRAQRGARPVFELALRWLHARRPPPPLRRSLVHGDFRTGNLLVEPAGLRAVLDWELAHVGDPMADLGWFCVPSWRFGELDAPAGGFGTREALLEAYRAAGGDADAGRLRWWEVMGMLRWGVMCVDMAAAWRTGRDRSVERVAVGRRASEVELDLLRALAPRDRGGSPHGPDATDGA